MSLYENMNKRKAMGKSRTKKKSTINDKVYAQMRAGKGPFKKKQDET